MGADVKTLKYLVDFGTMNAAKMRKEIKAAGGSVTKFDDALKKATKSSKSLMDRIGKLAARAAVIIPIWIAMRNVMTSFINTAREGLTHIRELDKAMARVAAVTRGTGGNTSKFLGALKGEIRFLSIETGESVEKIAEAFHRIATAGIDAEVAWEGMKVAIKTGIAIMGDSTQTARTMADIYNVMGDNIDGATTAQEKMQMVGSTMAILWQNNNFTLSEFTTGLRTFASTAKNFGLTFDETMASLAAAGNLMQRGGTAGNRLSRSFIMMTNNLEKVNIRLKRNVDLQKERIFPVFLEILKSLNKEFGDSPAKMKAITDIFGKKGSQVVGAFATKLSLVNRELKRLSGADLVQRMKALDELYKLQMHTIDRQLKIFRELKQVMFEGFVIGISGTEDFVSAMENINDFLKNTMISTFIDWGVSIRRVLDLLSQFSLWNPKTVAGGVRQAIDILTPMGSPFKLPPSHRERAGHKKAIEDVSASSDFAKSVITGSFVPSWLKPSLQKKEAATGVEKMKILSDRGLSEEESLPFLSKAEETQFVFAKLLNNATDINELLDKNISKNKELLVHNAKMADLKTFISETLAYQLQETMLLEGLGASRYQIELKKLELMEKSSELIGKEEETAKQILKVRKALNKELLESTAISQDLFKGGLEELLLGKTDMSSFFNDFADGIRKALMGTVSEGITGVLSATGLFEGMGGALSGLKAAFGGIQAKLASGMETGSVVAYKAIFEAFGGGSVVAAENIRKALIPGSSKATFSAAVGGGGHSGVVGSLDMLAGGDQGIQQLSNDNWVVASTGQAATSGQIAKQKRFNMMKGVGVAAGAAMTGYSAFQQAKQSGGGFAAYGGAALTTMGSTLLGAAAAGLGGEAFLAAMGGPVGWIALGVTLLGGALGMFGGGKKEQFSVETKTSENRVASKIDVTNNKLELVNRNLVALRSDFSTYILPSSSYFSQGGGIEDEFSLQSKR